MPYWVESPALEFGHIADDLLLVETPKMVIQQRANFPGQSEPALSKLPRELQRLFLLAPISRDCSMLRVLLRIPVGTCSKILRVGIEEIGDVLCAALQQLPLLGVCSSTRREITQV